MKLTLDDLAFFGGAAAFREPLHVGRPNIGDRQALMARIEDILDRRWLTNHGPYVDAFEQRICAITGARHCIAVANATLGLEIAIRASSLTGEVIVPSFTFIATAHALQWQGITPVFCDIDPLTHTLDPDKIEALITPKTTGILAVHVWGRPCAVEALEQIAQRHGLTLLFDAAHAFGCSHNGRMIGNFSAAEVFSFHATKFLNSFEGGAVVTNDDALAQRVRLMMSFGFSDYDTVDSIGTNAKMTEIAAAMGITSLDSMDEFIAVNRRNYQQYRQVLADLPGVELIVYPEHERCNFQYVVIEVDEQLIGVSRDQLHQILVAENILARRYFYPGCHQMEPYRSTFPDAGRHLRSTEQLAERVLSLPTGTSVGPEQIQEIGRIIRLVATHGAAVRAELAARAEHAVTV